MSSPTWHGVEAARHEAMRNGDHVEYEVETQVGTIVCLESDPDVSAVHAEGDAVRVGFVPSRAWVLPDDGE